MDLHAECDSGCSSRVKGTLFNAIKISIHPPTNRRMKRRMQFILFAKVISTTSEPWHKDSQERF
jgi:hypothetical protein